MPSISNTTYINGDWTVNDTQVRENETVVLTGNLTVVSGGTLTFKNVTLLMNCTATEQWRIDVRDGGALFISDQDGNNITTEDASVISANNSTYNFLFLVREQATFEMRNSELHECGGGYIAWPWIPSAPNTAWYGMFIMNNSVIVDRCNISNNRYGIVLYDSDAIISNNTVDWNYCGILSGYWSNGTIVDNHFNWNEIYSIWVNGGSSPPNDKDSNPYIARNIILNTGRGIFTADSIQINSGSCPVITNNIIINYTEDAIYCGDQCQAIIENNYIDPQGGRYGIVGSSSRNVFVKNCTIIDNSVNEHFVAATMWFHVINCTFNQSKVWLEGSSIPPSIEVGWHLNLHVEDQTGNPVSGATVQITDNANGTYNKTFIADADGRVRSVELIEYNLTKNGTTRYTAHQLNVSCKGYFPSTLDVMMNESKDITVTLQADDEPPKLHHTPIVFAQVNEPIDATVNVTDNMEVSNVTLYYQNVDDLTYTHIDMTPISDDWSAIIPTQTKTGTVHYFIWANDSSGNNVTSPAMGDYSIQITGPPGIDITGPKGGEIFTGGSEQWIEFTASDTEDSPSDLIVFLNYTSGASNVFIEEVTGASSSYSWTLPNINATDVKINATVIDSDGNKAFAESPLFTIDSTPPSVISTNPANKATGVSVHQQIVIQFNEPMNVSSVVVNQTNGTDPNGWQWFWNETGNTLMGIHDAWQRGEVVEITVHTGYMDASEPGNANNTAYVFTFTTEINPPPEIVHANVLDQQELGDAIRINATITDNGVVMNAVLWWRDVDGVWRENYMQKNGNEWFYLVPGQMAEGKVRYQINATDNLGQKNTTAIYEFDSEDSTPPMIAHTPTPNAFIGEPMNITCMVADLGGVDVVYLHYKNESEANFTQVMMNPSYWYELATRSLPVTMVYYIKAVDQYGNEVSTEIYNLEIIDPAVSDTTPPEVLFVEPTGVGVPVTTSISIVFSEVVDRISVENTITVSPTITGITYTWLNDQTLIVSFNALQYNTTYTVTIGTGTTDLAGNALASAYSWEFTTEMEPETMQQPVSNDWGWIGIIIFLIVIIALMLLYLFNKEKKEPDNTKKES